MKEPSRIKFNPVTKEIEIEGSEKFVKTYFDRIRALMDPRTDRDAPQTLVGKEKDPYKHRFAKSLPEKGAGVSANKSGTNAGKVISLLRESNNGLTTTELKDKTGLEDKQIWAIIYRAEKMGKIRKAKRGIYVAA